MEGIMQRSWEKKNKSAILTFFSKYAQFETN